MSPIKSGAGELMGRLRARIGNDYRGKQIDLERNHDLPTFTSTAVCAMGPVRTGVFFKRGWRRLFEADVRNEGYVYRIDLKNLSSIRILRLRELCCETSKTGLESLHMIFPILGRQHGGMHNSPIDFTNRVRFEESHMNWYTVSVEKDAIHRFWQLHVDTRSSFTIFVNCPIFRETWPMSLDSDRKASRLSSFGSFNMCPDIWLDSFK